MGEAQGRRAMIKSNTERIRSDVTQAVRAESTPCGMQKPSAEKLSVPQKKFLFPTIPQPRPHSRLCLLHHKQRSLESTGILYIYPSVFSLCVCVLAGNVQPNPMAVWSGLGWSRQLSQLQKS